MLGWPAREFQASCLHPPSSEIIGGAGGGHNACFLFVCLGAGIPNSSLSAFVEHTSPTQSSPQPSEQGFQMFKTKSMECQRSRVYGCRTCQGALGETWAVVLNFQRLL